MADYKGVMVLGEGKDGKLAIITTELLGCGRRLADELGEPLCCLLPGKDTVKLAKEAIAFGADKVYVASDGALETFQTATYRPVVEKVVREAMPRIVLMGQNTVGRDLAPSLAFKLETTVVTDCVEMSIDSGSKALLATKPVYGGNAQAVFSSEVCPQVVTVRAKAMTALARDDGRKGEVVEVAAKVDKVKTKVLDKVVEDAEGIRLEDADVVVAGGRGIGSAEGFKQLEELAKLFKGAVGASRPPVDNEWAPTSYQIGLTGKIIAPELYFAIGISGASQHITGISSVRTVVAINKDPDANIFREASYGVVGDWKKILPAFTEKVRELLAN